MGQTLALFVYFRPFHNALTNIVQNLISIGIYKKVRCCACDCDWNWGLAQLGWVL